ncbi:putative ABC transporter permease [Gorillibacterium timonense]|uniref:putative ABC transporter permease n=1 Tax=Gorillibacterium timonense TaxID=1689269 RepID=UPI00071C3313|nr:putative ABC transporter permease [Gorillibacterium timonense]
MNVWAEWLFYYTVYGIAGWLLENGYSLATVGVFWKEGFLFTPLKPMYGIAMAVLAAVQTGGGSPIFVVFCCLVVPSAIEFASGFLLDKGFGRRYWDYRSMKGNVEGYVCPSFSLCWVPLSLICVYGLQPYLTSFYERIASSWNAVFPWLVMLMVIEFAVVVGKRRVARGMNPMERDMESEPNGFAGEGSPEANMG